MTECFQVRYRHLDPFQDTERERFYPFFGWWESYRHLDPFEDTESRLSKSIKASSFGYRHLDPFQDTESMANALLKAIQHEVTGISIRFRILKEPFQLRASMTGSVTGISIRFRILKVDKAGNHVFAPGQGLQASRSVSGY